VCSLCTRTIQLINIDIMSLNLYIDCLSLRAQLVVVVVVVFHSFIYFESGSRQQSIHRETTVKSLQ